MPASDLTPAPLASEDIASEHVASTAPDPAVPTLRPRRWRAVAACATFVINAALLGALSLGSDADAKPGAAPRPAPTATTATSGTTATTGTTGTTAADNDARPAAAQDDPQLAKTAKKKPRARPRARLVLPVEDMGGY